jgi:hypothetical protein
MNLFKRTLTFAAFLGSLAFAQAAQPTFDWWSAGQFRTSGYYPMGYHVYVSDADGDLVQTRVDALHEQQNWWETSYGSGDNWYQEVHGWGESVDCYSPARVYLTDTVDTYVYDIELYF